MRVHRIARKLRIRMSLLTRRISYTKDLGGHTRLSVGNVMGCAIVLATRRSMWCRAGLI